MIIDYSKKTEQFISEARLDDKFADIEEAIISNTLPVKKQKNVVFEFLPCKGIMTDRNVADEARGLGFQLAGPIELLAFCSTYPGMNLVLAAIGKSFRVAGLKKYPCINRSISQKCDKILSSGLAETTWQGNVQFLMFKEL